MEKFRTLKQNEETTDQTL